MYMYVYLLEVPKQQTCICMKCSYSASNQFLYYCIQFIHLFLRNLQLLNGRHVHFVPTYMKCAIYEVCYIVTSFALLLTVFCIGSSNKIVAVHSQDSIRTCKPHAVLEVHCNYIHVYTCVQSGELRYCLMHALQRVCW